MWRHSRQTTDCGRHGTHGLGLMLSHPFAILHSLVDTCFQIMRSWVQIPPHQEDLFVLIFYSHLCDDCYCGGATKLHCKNFLCTKQTGTGIVLDVWGGGWNGWMDAKNINVHRQPQVVKINLESSTTACLVHNHVVLAHKTPTINAMKWSGIIAVEH